MLWTEQRLCVAGRRRRPISGGYTRPQAGNMSRAQTGLQSGADIQIPLRICWNYIVHLTLIIQGHYCMAVTIIRIFIKLIISWCPEKFAVTKDDIRKLLCWSNMQGLVEYYKHSTFIDPYNRDESKVYNYIQAILRPQTFSFIKTTFRYVIVQNKNLFLRVWQDWYNISVYSEVYHKILPTRSYFPSRWTFDFVQHLVSD